MPPIDWSSIFSLENGITHLAWAIVLSMAGWVWQKAGGREIWRGKRWLYWPVSILSVFIVLTAVSHPQMLDFSRSDIPRIAVGSMAENPSTTTVTFYVAIRNTGAESAIDNYQAAIIMTDGTKIEGQLIPPDSTLHLKRSEGDTRPEVTFPPSDSIVAKTLEPISRGRVVGGVIAFGFDKVRRESALTLGTKATLTFRDVFGKQYTISHTIDGKGFD